MPILSDLQTLHFEYDNQGFPEVLWKPVACMEVDGQIVSPERGKAGVNADSPLAHPVVDLQSIAIDDLKLKRAVPVDDQPSITQEFPDVVIPWDNWFSITTHLVNNLPLSNDIRFGLGNSEGLGIGTRWLRRGFRSARHDGNGDDGQRRWKDQCDYCKAPHK